MVSTYDTVVDCVLESLDEGLGVITNCSVGLRTKLSTTYKVCIRHARNMYLTVYLWMTVSDIFCTFPSTLPVKYRLIFVIETYL
jgi:hypothetical protein